MTKHALNFPGYYENIFICNDLKYEQNLLMSVFLIYTQTICFSVIEWMEHHMVACPSKKIFNLECPGCGMQRSFWALLKGDISESFGLYPAMIPFLIMVIFTGIQIKFDFKYGADIIKWGQIFVGILILAFYFYKLLTHKTSL